MKYDIFISYRRDGGEYTAKILRDRLGELGYHVFFDVESLRSGDFNTRLYSVIDECRDFLLILSPGALARCEREGDWVRREVEYALEKGKNIVPIMLRGFSFPDNLPESMDAVRYKNGLEANTQFFDAFIQKLQQFLVTKLSVWQRIIQNTFFRKTVPLFLALLLLVLIGTAAAVVMNLPNRTNSDSQGEDSAEGMYPYSQEEKNLTREAVYYISLNLTNLNIMADAIDGALETARQYIYAGSLDYTSFQSKLEVSRHSFLQADLSVCSLSEDLVGRLSASPFSVDDFKAMYDSIDSFRREWTSSLTYIEWLTSPDAFLDLGDKLKIIERYQIMLDENLLMMASCTNEMLLPVTDETALDNFLYITLPELTHIPLNAANWSDSKKVLQSAQDESYKKLNDAMMDLSVLLGNYSVENAMMKEKLIQGYMEIGFTRNQAEQYVQLLLRRDELYLKAYEKFSPEEGDDVDRLWGKMLTFLSIGLYDGAASCVDAVWELEKDSNKYAAEYVPMLYRFIDNIEVTGIDYGVMVVGYYEPDGINEVFKIGDVVVAFEGEPCHHVQEYIEMKNRLTESDYTVTVLRTNEDGTPGQVMLELTKDMPRVEIRSLGKEE